MLNFRDDCLMVESICCRGCPESVSTNGAWLDANLPRKEPLDIIKFVQLLLLHSHSVGMR